MKRCTTCNLEYQNKLLKFCRLDGTTLISQEMPTAETERLPTFAQKAEQLATINNARSIAVLPFINLSADADNDLFCDGLTEELIGALARISQLRVASRTSSFAYKGKDINIRTIGEALNVVTLLEGSVRRIGERVRITVQLIDATDGYHLWSQRYDCQFQDVFDLQDQISAAILKVLKPVPMRVAGTA